jgi:hypothetical protein
MFDELFKKISEHYPLLLILLCAIVATWIVANRYNHWSNRVKRAEEECKKIDTHLNHQLLTINSSLNTLNGNFNSLVIYLKGKHGEMDASLFISRSPIQLTDLGKLILREIGGQEFIDHNIDELIKEMNILGIKTALDSQTNAPLIITQMSSKDSFNKIKDYAFKHPYYIWKRETGEDISIPLDMGTITNIMGIYLRDKYLEKHPHLNPADIP